MDYSKAKKREALGPLQNHTHQRASRWFGTLRLPSQGNIGSAPNLPNPGQFLVHDNEKAPYRFFTVLPGRTAVTLLLLGEGLGPPQETGLTTPIGSPISSISNPVVNRYFPK